MPTNRFRYLLQPWLVLAFAASDVGCQSPPQPYEPGRPYETVARDPHRDTAAARRGNTEAIALIGRGKWSDAQSTLRRALADDVTFGPAHSNLGSTYEHAGDHYLAAWEYQYAATLMPEAPEPRNNLGLVFEAVGKLDDAIQWYDRAVALRPESSEYEGNDARARLKRGDRDARVRDLLRGVVMRDERQAWVRWARERLSTMPAPATSP